MDLLEQMQMDNCEACGRVVSFPTESLCCVIGPGGIYTATEQPD